MNTLNLIVCTSIVIFVIGCSDASPWMNRDDSQVIEKCRAVCKQCDCIGFYCGDQCICECPKANSGKCLAFGDSDKENVNRKVEIRLLFFF